MAGAFAPSWSPDGQWIAFGLGEWFQERHTGKARIMRVRRDGTGAEALTDGTVHSGFPSYSADGKQSLHPPTVPKNGCSYYRPVALAPH
jgi:Tol biopolymer transport system component